MFSLQILTSLANNSLEVYNLPPPASSKAPAVEPIKLLTLDLPGHRSDVRCLAVSSDDQLIASASHGTLKLWNVKTTKCVRTMDCGYAICCSFLPGDRHVSLVLWRRDSPSTVSAKLIVKSTDRGRYQVRRTPPLRSVVLLPPRDFPRPHRPAVVSPRPSRQARPRDRFGRQGRQVLGL